MTYRLYNIKKTNLNGIPAIFINVKSNLIFILFYYSSVNTLIILVNQFRLFPTKSYIFLRDFHYRITQLIGCIRRKVNSCLFILYTFSQYIVMKRLLGIHSKPCVVGLPRYLFYLNYITAEYLPISKNYLCNSFYSKNVKYLDKFCSSTILPFLLFKRFKLGQKSVK